MSKEMHDMQYKSSWKEIKEKKESKYFLTVSFSFWFFIVLCNFEFLLNLI